MIEDPTPEIEAPPVAIEAAAPAQELPPQDEQPAVLVTLEAYAAAKNLPHWLLAALRTACPIEQHMRHGHTKSEDGATQAEYLAHTGRHGKTIAEWDQLAHDITNLPIGVS